MKGHKVTFVLTTEEVRLLKMMAYVYETPGGGRAWDVFAAFFFSRVIQEELSGNTVDGVYAPFEGMTPTKNRHNRSARVWHGNNRK